jgi:hypothetical protein
VHYEDVRDAGDSDASAGHENGDSDGDGDGDGDGEDDGWGLAKRRAPRTYPPLAVPQTPLMTRA